MTSTERIAEATALLARYQHTPWHDAALAFMRAQIEIVRRSR